jgi:hypothetical protein
LIQARSSIGFTHLKVAVDTGLEELTSPAHCDPMNFPSAILASQFKIRVLRIVEEPDDCQQAELASKRLDKS